ncbi:MULTISPECIES: lipid-A-disaccharide synthase [unclassified Hydrogenophaga]|uniref:lipid-A-disaccharide synthase n=1 Tax=unclassified Hydrogenophaga TaxID=2610897 RepID=UPI0009F55764|nr:MULTISPECIES: lipid-A-disaccharide synthase [unclassified Hydrogenophaga]MBN9371598.1 lipid-A-disaccharide synthase [Hydrogenophaga sp.]
MSASPRFALVAGEASGDLLAGLLLGGLRQRWPGLTGVGIGGPQMVAQGFDAWWPSERLAVRGYVEVLRHYREIVGIRQQLRQRLLQGERPDVFIGVDAPDFNLELEASLKAAGVRTVHFVCPSIWAWRPERVRKIQASADHVLCIFPFEPALLAEHGIAATYVGHPVANVVPLEPDRQAARRQLGLPEDAEVVALLPGSRGSEVDYLAHRFFEAARLMRRARQGLRFVLPAVPVQRERIERVAREAGVSDLVQVVPGQSHAVLAACDATLIASGTATLEAALFKRPMVIAYNMNWLSWQIMRRQRLQPWVGLPNILCQDFVVPELLQEEASPQRLAQAVLDWLDAPERVRALQARFTQLHHQLRRDTAALATDAIEALLAR